jgi:ABC-type glutathione transport system ATPase component
MTAQSTIAAESRVAGVPLVHLEAVRKEYAVRGAAPFVAVDDVTLDVHTGETLAIVGESGSGKTTLTRLLLGLLEPTSGQVTINGVDLAGCGRRQLLGIKREMQVVFQDPYSSMNPRMRVSDIIGEPLVTHLSEYRGRSGGRARVTRVSELLEAVGLEAAAADRFPHEFSGGQRQRISIARALALNPKLVILDEPTSALDVSVQAQVLELLAQLQRDLGLTYIFVSHNLAVVGQIADRVAVMRAGAVVELSDAAQLFEHPEQEYTQALLSAVLEPDPSLGRRRRATAA